MDLLAIVQAAAEVPLAGTVLRLVQQQGIDSLGPLVDDLDQLARLEALVESSKPPMPSLPAPATSHPLLTTPFRYPPLRHGSRFGGRENRGMFYGSRTRIGSLVEGAYYALLFWEGFSEPPQGTDPSPADPVLGAASNQPGPAITGSGRRRRSGRPTGPTALRTHPKVGDLDAGGGNRGV